MAFMIDPGQGNSTEGASQRTSRPDVRAGRKVLWAAGIQYGTSRAGNKKVDVCWVVVDDPDGGHDVGALVWDTLALTQSALWKVQILARAVGQKTSWDAENEEAMWEVVSRRPIVAEIEIEPKYSGEGTRGKVAKMHPFGGEPTDEQEKVAVEGEEWHRGWVAKKSGGRPAAPITPVSTNDFTDDDIPF
jgi:hypothetical protein